MTLELWKFDASGTEWSPAASFSIGYPTAGDVTTQTHPTHIGGTWFRGMAAEIKAVIEAAGLTFDPANVFQFLQAIEILLGETPTPPPPPPATPVADFTASPLSGNLPLAVTFTDTTNGGTPTAWAWTFGDGGTSSMENPTYSYGAAGTYTVALTATVAGSPYVNTKTNLITVTSVSTNYELREGGGRELREDGSFELRE